MLKMITIDEFKEILKDKNITDIEIVQKYITDGLPYIFNGDTNIYFKLKQKISEHFGLNPHNVIMIGSAKLGFSLSPNQLWKPFDDESDIDMLIISDVVFDKYWYDLYDFNIDLVDKSELQYEDYRSFMKHFFRGWVRPELFHFQYPGKKEWEDYFMSISYKEFGNNKITGAVFRTMEFYERYHRRNINNIRTLLNIGGINNE